MEYLIGLLTGVVFLLVFFGGIYVGLTLKPKTKAPKADDTEKQRLKKFNEDFQKLFSYDVAKATERKQV